MPLNISALLYVKLNVLEGAERSIKACKTKRFPPSISVHLQPEKDNSALTVQLPSNTEHLTCQLSLCTKPTLGECTELPSALAWWNSRIWAITVKDSHWALPEPVQSIYIFPELHFLPAFAEGIASTYFLRQAWFARPFVWMNSTVEGFWQTWCRALFLTLLMPRTPFPLKPFWYPGPPPKNYLLLLIKQNID
jgi:hypothetical protein